MMGLQATANKRKYEIGNYGETGEIIINCSPAKASRWSPNLIHSTSKCKSMGSSSGQLPSAEESIAKLEAVAAVTSDTWSTEPIIDSISKLQAVAVPDTWGMDSSRSAMATTLLSTDELDDEDDDFEDEFDEEDSITPCYSSLRYTYPAHIRGFSQSSYARSNYYPEPIPLQNSWRPPNHYSRPCSHYGWNGYYSIADSPSQQTIRCAENGKSYLELGSSSPISNNGRNFINDFDPKPRKRCCDGKNNWCNNKQCYRDRRLKMRNMSMFKLSRFRQLSEQSLYRSVLICNTLKYIDREIELEMKETANQHPLNDIQYIHNLSHRSRLFSGNNQHRQNRHELHSVKSNVYNTCDNRISNFMQPYSNRASTIPTFITTAFNESLPPYDHHPLKESLNGRVTPFPLIGSLENDSGYGDEDCTRPINWGSVLSLSSQSALDPLNNNDLFNNQPSNNPTMICMTTPSTTLSYNITNNSNSDNSISNTTATRPVLHYDTINNRLNSSNNRINNINTNSDNSNGSSIIVNNSLIINNSQSLPVPVVPPTTNWEYNLLDMDLGLDPELTELLPSWKLTQLSADDILKSVPTAPDNRAALENEIDTVTHIMVGS